MGWREEIEEMGCEDCGCWCCPCELWGVECVTRVRRRAVSRRGCQGRERREEGDSSEEDEETSEVEENGDEESYDYDDDDEEEEEESEDEVVDTSDESYETASECGGSGSSSDSDEEGSDEDKDLADSEEDSRDSINSNTGLSGNVWDGEGFSVGEGPEGFQYCRNCVYCNRAWNGEYPLGDDGRAAELGASDGAWCY